MARDVTYRFSGRERITIELDGTFAPGALRIPDRLALEVVDGRARVSLFAFFVEDIAVAGLPFVRSSYAELLWRIAVRDGGMAAWWIAACDLAALGPRIAARRWVRYPTRARKHIDIDDRAITCDGLAVALGAADGAASVEVRPVLVGPAAEWEVPWGDEREPAVRVPVAIEDGSLAAHTVGDSVSWASAAAVRRGRQHRCGTARRR